MRKKMIFNISYEEFLCFQKMPCDYCGTTTEKIVGIDRVKNDIGYEVGNYVPCCKTCNYGKGNRDLKEWVSWLNKIKSNGTIKNEF